MKLFAVFSFTIAPMIVLSVFAYSLIAGAAIGLARATLSGELVTVLRSTARIAANPAVKPLNKFGIPFSGAILMGWMTYYMMGAVV
jgi:hypothetical protein